MTPREHFVAALARVSHFELVFLLATETFGKVHPSHHHYAQWDQMEEGK